MADAESNKSIFSRLWEARTIISFWWLGLCNNYGYVVMLSAAHDILSDFDVDDHVDIPFNRDCNTLSTGIILLADIVPTILVKIIAPFLPLRIYIRMAGVILLSAIGFVLVASRWDKWVVLLGVVCTSFSCGLGETTLLSYMVFFKTKNVLSTWSSGTGGAGILGAGSYAGLTAVGVSPSNAIWIMLIVPTIQAICFIFLIDHPKIDVKVEGSEIPTEADLLTWKEKLSNPSPAIQSVPVPLPDWSILISLFNEHSEDRLVMDHGYTSVMQRLLGGGCYVNTYRRIASEMEKDQRQFGMGICGVADALMITFAGILANPAHNGLCNTKKPYPYVTPRKTAYYLKFFPTRSSDST
ncbi:battenin-like [Halyomorpha halys]|uniref:battenin-like n=1 Tax=Halyomorpha halys TaxID=286706 RepID=UPI0034D37DEC